MAMSKQDYEKLAWALRYTWDDMDGIVAAPARALAFDTVLSRIIQALRDTNPRFDADRFRQYVTSHCVNCGGSVEKEENQFCNRCAKLPKKDLT